ncbi:MAG TPA: flagellar filament protein FlaA [Spirochaetes bacterium]|nr:flagellar filament protein FlaA [Spirochaetota bacterium]
MTKIVFILLTLIIAVFIPLMIFAQDQQDVDNLQVGIETGTQLLVELPVAHFEDADTWRATMPSDQGVIFSMRRKGRPLEVLEVDENDGTENEFVLGVKVAFNHRGYNYFVMAPPRPVKIPGITKAISLWVAGRSYRHRLYIHILDYRGEKRVLDMGLLDFVGWKKLAIAIPTNIAQDNFNNTEWRGISFTGMSIETDPLESYGVFYVYFDELRATTDIYNEEYRDEDDMEDGW